MQNTETIILAAIRAAVQMGLDSKEFENVIRNELKQSSITQVRAYTLDFLQLLMKSDNSFSMNDVGINQPKTFGNNAAKYCKKYDAKLVEQKVVRGKDAWKPGKDRENTTLDVKINAIRCDLNKISTDNEQKISARLCVEITEDCLETVTSMFFDKGICEQKYRDIYARLCVLLNTKFPNVFIHILTKQCQNEANVTYDEDAEDDIIVSMMRRRAGALKFAVNLFKNKLVEFPLFISCLTSIIKPNPSSNIINDYSICHASDLLIDIVPIVDKQSIQRISFAVRAIRQLEKTQKMGVRIKIKIEEMDKICKIIK